MDWRLWVLAWYGAWSVIAFAGYAWDKRAAKRGRRRISERRLLELSLMGGWPGAWLAMRALRHKTLKKNFRRTFWAIVALHAGGWLFYAWILLR